MARRFGAGKEKFNHRHKLRHKLETILSENTHQRRQGREPSGEGGEGEKEETEGSVQRKGWTNGCCFWMGAASCDKTPQVAWSDCGGGGGEGGGRREVREK